MDFCDLFENLDRISYLCTVQERKGMTWEQIAVALYQILDDISTTDDACKENAEAFRSLVMKLQAKKNEYMYSPDGFTIKRVNENFTEWARKELELAGLFDKDSDYEGMLGQAIMELIEKFSEQGHSGMSAGLVSSIFHQLSQWKPLTELTDNPDEWNELSEEVAADHMQWQSSRDPSCFSTDGGKTYWSTNDKCFEFVDEDGTVYFTSSPERWAKRTIHTSKRYQTEEKEN